MLSYNSSNEFLSKRASWQIFKTIIKIFSTIKSVLNPRTAIARLYEIKSNYEIGPTNDKNKTKITALLS